jgi:hypothetical protein
LLPFVVVDVTNPDENDAVVGPVFEISSRDAEEQIRPLPPVGRAASGHNEFARGHSCPLEQGGAALFPRGMAELPGIDERVDDRELLVRQFALPDQLLFGRFRHRDESISPFDQSLKPAGSAGLVDVLP